MSMSATLYLVLSIYEGFHLARVWQRAAFNIEAISLNS